MERRRSSQQQQQQEYATIPSGTTAGSFRVRVPCSDMDTCIGVPIWRGLLTVLSLLLAVTDIPRTGLVFRLTDYYRQVAPGTVMNWGPYEYHVVHLNTSTTKPANTTRKYEAFTNGAQLPSIDLWPYKYDTLSIAPRALAARWNLSSYSPCVLYHGNCEPSRLAPETVFHMLNELVDAAKFHIPSSRSSSSVSARYAFATKSAWIDRLHHYVFRIFTKNPQPRLHTIYHASSGHDLDPLHLCDGHPHHGLHIERPAFCDHAVAWPCDHPIHVVGIRQVPIWDHIAIRVNDLQTRYPQAKLDMVLMTTRFVEGTNPRDSQTLPNAQYSSDTSEVTTIIRGRQADGENETVFIDDFRYERATTASFFDQWPKYTWVLRGLAQCYMWLRISLLICGCHHARSHEPKYRRAKIPVKWLATLVTILKIPGHAVVYGSWLPVCAYALAHFFDSCLVHSVGEYTFTSIEGSYIFHPFEYIMETSTQMRNAWMIALLGKLALYVSMAMTTGRLDKNDPTANQTIQQRQGVLGYRSCWIGVVSWLTTLGFARSLRFRDTRILAFHELRQEQQVDTIRDRGNVRFYNYYGARFDLKCIVAATIFIVTLGIFYEFLVRFVTNRKCALFTMRSFYVPLSAGPIWPLAMLDAVWLYDFPHQWRQNKNNAVAIQPVSSSSGVSSSSIVLAEPQARRGTGTGGTGGSRSAAVCSVCTFQPSLFHWRATQGCPTHEPILDIHRRTKALWSMVRLTNIAAMTDPIVLFQLYILGRPLYLYRVPCIGNEPSYLILMPALVKKDVKPQSESQLELELVATVDSRNVPWHVLVNCG